MKRAAVLAGVGAWLPPRVVSNDELPAELNTSDEWVRSRTGISQRHIAAPGMSTLDLAVEAGGRALASSGIRATDAVIVATTTPDRRCPATAPEVASRLGLRGAAAFDVSAVCTGFIYALASASGLIAAEVADRVLVIGADVYSSIVNPVDRGTAMIFGDGAGAVVLRAGEDEESGAFGPFDLGSDGTGSDLISVVAGGSRQPVPACDDDRYLTMAGREVFFQAVTRMAESSRAVLDQAGWSLDSIDRMISHQANRRIMDQLADQLGMDRSRLICNIDRVGNTAAASIPIALTHGVTQDMLRPGHRVLLTAFGGGLTWGSTVLNWPDVSVCGTDQKY